MQDRRLLYRQFQEIFPIESLKDMTWMNIQILIKQVRSVIG